MINTLILAIALIMLLYSSVKKNVINRSIGTIISLCLIASLIYTNKEELIVVIINIMFMLMLVTLSHKNYGEKE